MILIATESIDARETCYRALHGLGLVLSLNQYQALQETVPLVKPELVLLDYGLLRENGMASLSELARLAPGMRLMLFNVPASEDVQLKLIKAGARGCCAGWRDADEIRRMAQGVLKGELWVRRALLQRLVEEREGTRKSAVEENWNIASRLSGLTRREREIASLVGLGSSNKEIARRLNISERTVKAHLTEIFRKLGIGDRMTLALCIMERKLQGPPLLTIPVESGTGPPGSAGAAGVAEALRPDASGAPPLTTPTH